MAMLNPWLFKGRDELLSAFFGELREALGRTGTEHARDLTEALDKYRGAISLAAHATALGVDAAGGAGAATAATRGLIWLADKFRGPKPRSPQEERRSLEAKLKKGKTAVVVLIDELDRVEDDDVRAVAQLVKAVGDIKGISYLVAYDPERVADALGRGTGEDRRKTGEAYLEKIVQHPIPLRPLFTHDVDAMLQASLGEQGLNLPAELDESETAILDHIRNSISTPREIKRLVGAYTVLDRMVEGEVSSIDVLAYCWILTRSPGLRDLIANALDKFVDDPGLGEMSRRVAAGIGQVKEDPFIALGLTAKEQEVLLRLLFPRFGKTRQELAGDRLSKRRNLVRLLYLGDPPGIASRATVERLWAFDDVGALETRLRELLRDAELSTILDRVGDFLFRLPEAGDAVFWPALARALVRESDWLSGPEENGSLAEDAAGYLLRLGLRGTPQADRFRKILAALESSGDLAILPALLRPHLFAYALDKNRRSRRPDHAVLTETETLALWKRLEPRFRHAIRSGVLLKRLPRMDVGFTLTNMGVWDAKLRANLTAQLAKAEARATFAGLVVPPGYGIDKSSLDEMLDSDAVLKRMEKSGEGKSGSGTWLGQALHRLKTTLSGGSTMFSDED